MSRTFSTDDIPGWEGDAVAWLEAAFDAGIDYHYDDDPHGVRYRDGVQMFSTDAARMVERILGKARDTGIDVHTITTFRHMDATHAFAPDLRIRLLRRLLAYVGSGADPDDIVAHSGPEHSQIEWRLRDLLEMACLVWNECTRPQELRWCAYVEQPPKPAPPHEITIDYSGVRELDDPEDEGCPLWKGTIAVSYGRYRLVFRLEDGTSGPGATMEAANALTDLLHVPEGDYLDYFQTEVLNAGRAGIVSCIEVMSEERFNDNQQGEKP